MASSILLMTSLASNRKDDLDTMLADSIKKAGRSFLALPEPTHSQQVLKAQLDQIDKEINQTKNK